MNTTPLQQLSDAGVAVWLDDLSRQMIDSGHLKELLETRNVVGVTSNPTIFAKAVTDPSAYDESFSELARAGVPVEEAVNKLITDDVRSACDVLAPVYERTEGLDGRVSLEVSPDIAHDTDATIQQARELWSTVDRPNLFIKIPATREGLAAITAATAEGISVNVTLIFSLDRYRAVMNAYLTGLEQALEAGRDISQIQSVASFFISRIDTAIDSELEELDSDAAREVMGKAAIANGHLAYEAYAEVFGTPRWKTLTESGGNPQRPLWASTGVKNPEYRDVRYVEELIVNNCVNTMPGATMEAFADHGEVRGDTVTGRASEAEEVLDTVERLGISYVKVTEQLEKEGVSKFADSWSELVASVSDGLARFAGTDSPEEARQ
ncbi:MAG TPA: transaldolase [Actinomycetales bacterium]|nr:transaldolase [Actinomycetales bacterium]